MAEQTLNLVSEFGRTHNFNDVEGCPGDVVTQHLQLQSENGVKSSHNGANLTIHTMSNLSTL